MLEWFTDNLSTIIVSLILIAIVVSVIIKMIKDKKAGKSSCSCGCENCAMHGACHKKKL